LHNDFNVADLEFERVTSGSIKERRDSVTHLLFNITLLEVLFHFCGHPFEVHDAAFARIAMIRGI